MREVIVIGGGAAGLMAAVAAAEAGAHVTLLERNEKLGKKIYITGKGRCNATNACEPDAFMKSVVKNPRFLYYVLGLPQLFSGKIDNARFHLLLCSS